MTRRAALTIVAGGAALATSRSWAQDTSGRVIYPVAVPVYQTQFVADRIGKDLKDQGINSLEKLTDWKRPDGRKPIVSVSSLGGTNHVWASYYMETMGLDQKVTWIGTGNVDTMLGSLKSKQVDVLVSSLSLLNEIDGAGVGRAVI